jgi:hypothetical protein
MIYASSAAACFEKNFEMMRDWFRKILVTRAVWESASKTGFLIAKSGRRPRDSALTY